MKLISNQPNFYHHKDHPGLVLPRRINNKRLSKRNIQRVVTAYLMTGKNFWKAFDKIYYKSHGANQNMLMTTAFCFGAFQNTLLTEEELNHICECVNMVQISIVGPLLKSPIVWNEKALSAIVKNTNSHADLHFLGNYTGWTLENLHLIADFRYETFVEAFESNSNIPVELKVMRGLLSAGR